MKKITMLGALCALVATAPLAAQEMDGRWLPFVGCWEAIGGEEEIGVLCFEPADGGVQLTNVLDGDVASSEYFAADGQRREVTSEGCEGWEATTFSEDGRRVFTETEFLCGTDEPRAGTGVMTFVAPNMWADIRTLEADGEPFVWVQEYRLASLDRLAEEGVGEPAAELAMAVRASRQSAAGPIDLGDVEEALTVIDAKAVESWLVTKGDELDPSADDLVRMADAGVPENVIDAVVAVSHPDRFLVAAGGEVEAYDAPRPTSYRGYMGYRSLWRPRWGAGTALGYAPFGWALGYDPYYYQGYGYGGYGYGYGYGYNYWGSRPGTIIIERSDGNRGGTVINGSGYRRGASSSDDSAVRRAGGGAATRSGSPASSSGRSARPSSGSSSGSDSGRRAVRRRGGGGEGQVSRSSSAPRPAARPSAPARRPAAARPSAPRRAPAAGSSSSSSSGDPARGTARRRGGSK